MSVKKILVSQPQPTTEKSPYYDLEAKYGVEVVFRPFIKVEGLTSREFRQSKISIGDHTAVIFLSRTAIDHYFRLAKELRYEVPDTMKYFCISKATAHYLQKHIIYRKRKIFYSESGKVDDLLPILEKHKKEKYLYPMSDVHDSSASKLQTLHINYTPAVMYRTVSNDFNEGEALPQDYDMLIFFTPSGVKTLKADFPNFVQGDIAIGGMGAKTLNEIESQGLRLDVTTDSEAPSMAAAIGRYLEQHQQ